MFAETEFADDVCETQAMAPARASHTSHTLRSQARSAPGSTHASCAQHNLGSQALTRLDSIVSVIRVVKRGDALYRAGDTFQSIYKVRTGSLKTVVMHRDGREQVTGFHLAGDVLGLDGVCTERHSSDAIAIEESTVCVIPYHQLEAQCGESKSLQQHVLKLMSGEIVRESTLMMLLGTMNAEQRLAAFLLNLSSRMKTRGYSAVEFNLRMTREEMGSYLGMKLETVSRMFSKFQRDGLVQTKGKHIRIIDFDALGRV